MRFSHNLIVHLTSFPMFCNTISMRLPARHKYKAVQKVLKEKESISKVAKEYGVARKTLYLWIGRYQKLSPRKKASRAIHTIYKSGQSHPRFARNAHEQKVLREVIKNPHASITGLARTLRIGRHALFSILQERSLTTKEERVRFSKLHCGVKRVNSDTKRVIVDGIVKNHQSVSSLAWKYAVARKTIYAWLHQLEQTGHIQERYASGFSHPRALQEEDHNRVLDTVVADPKLSIHSLAQKFPYSSHGIWNILHSYQLTTQDARVAYAQKRQASLAILPKPSWTVAPVQIPFIPQAPSHGPPAQRLFSFLSGIGKVAVSSRQHFVVFLLSLSSLGFLL